MSLDFFNLPSDLRADVQWFTGVSALPGGPTRFVWRKPRGVSMVFILAIGAGAGGGGGFSAAAGNARGGGGGGGSGGVVRTLIPAFFVPDKLYCDIHQGGQGGAAGVAGSGSGNSFVLLTPYFGGTFLESPAWSDNTQAGGGGAGTGAAAGAGGSAATIGGYNISGLAGLGHLLAIAGQAGTNGGAHTGAVGTNITLTTTSLCLQGGAGGAGTQSADFAGGTYTATAGSYISENRPAPHAAGSVDGPGGPQLWKNFWSFGGAGGSSSNNGVGGNGGHGAIGSGGGGGGGGTTGGRGGNGGSGAVLFVSW